MHDTWRIKRNSGCHLEIILIYKNIYKKKKKSLNVSMSDGTNPFLLEGGNISSRKLSLKKCIIFVYCILFHGYFICCIHLLNVL